MNKRNTFTEAKETGPRVEYQTMARKKKGTGTLLSDDKSSFADNDSVVNQVNHAKPLPNYVGSQITSLHQLNQMQPRIMANSEFDNAELLKTPVRKTIDLDDYDVQIMDETENRRDLLRKSIVRVKKQDRNCVNDAPIKLEAALQNENNYLKEQFLGKNSNLIEDFFIIGIDESDIQLQGRQATNPDFIPAQSKVLYMYSDRQDCQRRNVVKDFCYPDGSLIFLEKLKSQQDFHHILYGQKDHLRKSLFVFNMQADDMSDKGY